MRSQGKILVWPLLGHSGLREVRQSVRVLHVGGPIQPVLNLLGVSLRFFQAVLLRTGERELPNLSRWY